MTFWRNATIKANRKQTENNNLKRHYAALRNHGLYKRAIDTNSSPCISSIHYKERSCLYASENLRGSITVEASVCFPIFFIIIMSLLYIINVMYIQTTLQIALEETVRHSSKAAYITSEFYSLSSDRQEDAVSNNPSLFEEIGASVLSSSWLHAAFLTDENRRILDNSPVKDGSGGISFLQSSFDLSNNTADIILSYTVTIPFIPEKILNFNMVNRCFVRLYSGLDMSKEQSCDDFYVYHTSTGNVYHTNRYCMYLLNYSDAVPFRDISRTLFQCRLCGDDTIDSLEDNNPIVYITNSGQVYHTTLKCPSFTGDVFRIHYSALSNSDQICEHCLKGK